MNKKVKVTLQKWLQLQSNGSHPLSQGDTLILWKGLFFCMYKLDRPSIQEQIAEQLASLIHCFPKEDASIDFYGAFLKMMNDEWLSIDRWQKPKFALLVRRVTRQCIAVLHNNDWEEKLYQQLSEHIEKIISHQSRSSGFPKCFSQIFLDELADVTAGNVGLIIKRIFDAMLYEKDLEPVDPSTSINDLGLLHQDDVDEDKIGTESYQPEKEIQKLNENKRKKGITDVEVQTKKIKLSKAEKLKMRKMEHLNNWAETDLMPEELPVNLNNSFNGNSSTDSDKENVNTDSDSWETSFRESRAEDFISRRKQRENKVNEANAKWFTSVDNQPSLSSSSPFSKSTSTLTNVKKKVTIVLNLNQYQEASEYFKQLQSCPKIIYDSVKKPAKGLLKLNHRFNTNNIRL